MRTLRVDFNSVHNGIVSGLIESASGESDDPSPGDSMRLYDGEHEMDGTVREVEHGLVSVEVDWNTWEPTPTRSDAPTVFVSYRSNKVLITAREATTGRSVAKRPSRSVPLVPA